MTFLLGFFSILKRIPASVWVIGIILLVGWRWHVNVVDEAVTVAVNEVKAEWAAETAQEDADAIKAREGWLAMVAARDADIQALKNEQTAKAAVFQTQLAKARKAAAALTAEVTRVTIEKPIAAVCALSDEHLSVRNAAIKQANASASGTTETSSGGLPRVLQGDSPRDTRIADGGTEQDFRGRHFDYSSLWRVPAYTPSAG